MPLSRAASAREWPSRIKAIARRRRTTAPSCIPAASSRSSLAENSRRVISIGLPICMTLCEALQAAQNRGTVDSAIPARVKLSVGWYYFATRPKPKAPQDLTTHSCINLRLPTHGGLYAWEFEKGKRELRVRVEGQLVFNGTAPMLDAALAGAGLAYVPEDTVRPHLADGRLIRVLADWCPPYSGYHLYYPSRRQPTPAFTLLADALRYRRT